MVNTVERLREVYGGNGRRFLRVVWPNVEFDFGLWTDVDALARTEKYHAPLLWKQRSSARAHHFA
jgi:hypothetical protein